MTAEGFAAEVASRASSKLSSAGTRRQSVRIGRASLQIAGDPGQGPWLGRAFPTDESDAGPGDDPHRLTFWDGTDPESEPPPRPWGPSDSEPLGVVASYSNDNVRCAFDLHVNSLIVYDLVSNASYTWFPSIAGLPAWAAASPFRVVISWLCNRRGMQVVHGAAVAVGGRAVLLAGPGGAGKSTTALACMLAGMGYLGDDYCAVEPSAGQVHMVYRTAKLFGATLQMLPALEAMVCNRDRMGQEKGVLFLDPAETPLVGSASLSAILIPEVTGTERARIRPASREEAVRAILPSTVGGMMGGTGITPRLILELVRSVPAFHIELGPDLASAVDVIADQLASGP